MIIDYNEAKIVLKNYAEASRLSDSLAEETLSYITRCLRYSVKEQGANVSTGVFVTCVMQKEDIVPTLNKMVEPLVFEGMAMLFDIFGDDKDRLQIRYTIKEYETVPG